MVPGSPFATPPGPAGLAADPSGKFLVVASASSQVSVFRIDRTTGALSAVPGSPFAGAGEPHVVVFSGNFLYVGNRGSNNISAYSLDGSSGNLTPLAGSPFSTGSLAIRSMTTDAGPQLVVAGTGLESFRLESDGSLTPLNGPTGPNSTWVTAAKQVLYVANSSGIAVFVERITGPDEPCDPDFAFLQCQGGGSRAGVEPSAVAIDPLGKFAFVSNSGSNDVSTLSITDDGALNVSLSLTSATAAGSGPFSLTVDPSGKFLYIANQLSNNVSVYNVGASDGALTAAGGSPFSTALGPTFIAAVR